jgi:ClpP class serine protease
LNTLVQNESWFTASEAVDNGLADKVNESSSNPVDEVVNLKNVVFNLQNEISQLKNQSQKEPTPIPAPQQNLGKLFLNLGGK